MNKVTKEEIERVSKKIDLFEIGTFSFLDNLGIVCRGKSIEKTLLVKDKFDYCILVGAHENSMKKLSYLFEGKKIVNKLNIKLDLMSLSTYEKLNIRDVIVGVTRDKDGNIPKKRKIEEAHERCNLNFVDLPYEVGCFFKKEPRTVSNGECAAVVAGFLGTRNAHIIGLDFYHSPYFINEKIPSVGLKKKKRQMVDSFYKICESFPETNFHLYTYCREIENRYDNLYIEVLEDN